MNKKKGKKEKRKKENNSKNNKSPFTERGEWKERVVSDGLLEPTAKRVG